MKAMKNLYKYPARKRGDNFWCKVCNQKLVDVYDGWGWCFNKKHGPIGWYLMKYKGMKDG